MTKKSYVTKQIFSILLITTSTSSKSSTHYLNDVIGFHVFGKDLSWGISVKGHVNLIVPLGNELNFILVFMYSDTQANDLVLMNR
jgi:hypothetical protein